VVEDRRGGLPVDHHDDVRLVVTLGRPALGVDQHAVAVVEVPGDDEHVLLPTLGHVVRRSVEPFVGVGEMMVRQPLVVAESHRSPPE
jgi:hypothetical protein